MGNWKFSLTNASLACFHVQLQDGHSSSGKGQNRLDVLTYALHRNNIDTPMYDVQFLYNTQNTMHPNTRISRSPLPRSVANARCS